MTGNGAAGKAQVQRAVQTVLGLKELPRPSHVADALGLAATGMSRVMGQFPTTVGQFPTTVGGRTRGSLFSAAGAQKWPPHSPMSAVDPTRPAVDPARPGVGPVRSVVDPGRRA
jgi:hypothetical protein